MGVMMVTLVAEGRIDDALDRRRQIKVLSTQRSEAAAQELREACDDLDPAVKRQAMDEAISVSCPHCLVDPGSNCRGTSMRASSGRLWIGQHDRLTQDGRPWPHRSRWERFLPEIREARVRRRYSST